MKLKSNVITVLMVISLIFGGITVQAQGVYSDNSKKESAEKVAADAQAASQTGSSGGLFRAPGDNWWDDIDEGAGGVAGGDPKRSPVGEGLLILSLLSGVYALVKRRSKKKHED